MALRMWTYDVAREQCPSLDFLRGLCRQSLDSGYNALGLYLEHRFAYPSAPWIGGKGAVTPEMVKTLQKEFKGLNLVPFVNLLGHCEGILFTERGRKFAEEKFGGMQGCPSNPEYLTLVKGLLDDVLNTFSSEIVHLGGDEAQQLGKCSKCAAKVASFEQGDRIDGKARLFGLHFGELARHVLDSGKRPAIWSDMCLAHPQALDYLPLETLIFFWEYFSGPAYDFDRLSEKHEVVLCPTLHGYNAPWLHLPQSSGNVISHMTELTREKVAGLCLTTWEHELFGNLNTVMPAVKAVGRLLSEKTSPARNDKIQIKLDAESADSNVPMVRLSIAIVHMMVDMAAEKVDIQPLDDTYFEVKVASMGHEYPSMRIPSTLRDHLFNRLRLMTGMSPVGRNLEQFGKLEGEVDGIKFSYDAVSRPDGQSFSMTRTTKLPMLKFLTGRSADLLGGYSDTSEEYLEWARLMGVELQLAGGVFGFSGHRNRLKCHLLLYGNPFLAWLHHGPDLCGESGDRALATVERALSVAPDTDTRGVSQFIKSAIEFVRFAEQAHQAYAQELPGVAVSCLAPARQIFDDLAKIAVATNLNAGGSLADVERCKVAKEMVERVVRRIRDYGDGNLGYLPSFEHLTHTNFMPHDQGAWWRINSWGLS